MSITTLITQRCTQVAVYWGSPQEDGYGGKTFSDPVERKCRWEAMNQLVTDSKGVEFTSRAVVYILEDVDEEGYLYLGTLDQIEPLEGDYTEYSDGTYFMRKGIRNGTFVVDKELTATGFDGTEGTDWANIAGWVVSEEVDPLADENAPLSLEGAYIIKRFEKTPMLGSTTEFLRKAYLTPSLSFGGF